MEANRKATTAHRGIALIESIVSLFIVAMLTALVVSLGGVRTGNAGAVQRAKAAAVADEAMNALRRLDYNQIPTQTNGPLINLIANGGTWTTAVDSSEPLSHSAPTVIETPLVSGVSTNVPSARLQFPTGVYRDPTAEAAWKIAADSPSAWSVGMLLHSRDLANGYRFRVAQNDVSVQTDLDGVVGNGVQNVLLERLVGGTATTLIADAATISKDAWFRLTLSSASGTLTVKLNGTTIGTAADATYSVGPLALAAWGGTHALVDDAKTVPSASCTATTCWDFAGATALPVAWIRFGGNDLPDATPTVIDDNVTLTTVPYPTIASADLKQAVVTVTWTFRNVTKTFVATGLLGRSTVGQ